MDDELPPQSELDEFLDSLSRSAALDEIRVSVSADESRLILEVTYQFADRDAHDGKPVALGLTVTPAMLQDIHAVGCEASDPEADNDAVLRSSLALIVAAHELAGWNGAALTARLSWPSPDADDSELFLRIPEQLPLVITGIRDGSQPVRLPRFLLHIDASAKECFVGGTVSGSEWPDENAPMEMLHAVLARPGYEIVTFQPTEPTAQTRHAIRWSSRAMAAATDEERSLFTQLSLGIPLILERMLGMPVTTRSLVVADTEAPKAGGLGISNLLAFYGVSDDAAFLRQTGHLVLRFSRIWWGSGVRVSGPQRDLVELAIGNSMSMRIQQWIDDKPLDPEPMLSRLRLRGSGMAVGAMTFGASIFVALRSDDEKKEAFRELTRLSWRTSVPDRDVLAWFRGHGIHVPANTLAP